MTQRGVRDRHGGRRVACVFFERRQMLAPNVLRNLPVYIVLYIAGCGDWFVVELGCVISPELEGEGNSEKLGSRAKGDLRS
jgi:hypothetical protein